MDYSLLIGIHRVTDDEKEYEIVEDDDALDLTEYVQKYYFLF